MPITGSEVEVLDVDDAPACNENPTDHRKKGTTRQRNYTLNDIGALKKKISHEKRSFDFMISKEAVDNSNVVIPMRASFFEFLKRNFIEDLERDPSIVNIENAERVKAATETVGDAFVEYSLEITFTSQSKTDWLHL